MARDLEKVKQAKKTYRQKYKIQISAYRKLYNREHKEEIIAYNKNYGLKYKEEKALYNKIYNLTHKKDRSSYYKSIRKRKNELQNIYRKRNLNARIERVLRSRLRKALKSVNSEKCMKTKDMLGCSIEELKQHLESKFYPNKETGEMMTWENRGFYGWHIDHIKPISKFNLDYSEQQKECFHYTNLQPLWWKENLIKHNH